MKRYSTIFFLIVLFQLTSISNSFAQRIGDTLEEVRKNYPDGKTDKEKDTWCYSFLNEEQDYYICFFNKKEKQCYMTFMQPHDVDCMIDMSDYLDQEWSAKDEYHWESRLSDELVLTCALAEFEGFPLRSFVFAFRLENEK